MKEKCNRAHVKGGDSASRVSGDKLEFDIELSI